jgi:polyferredoxin/uncharacterized protein with FMN-binding domain
MERKSKKVKVIRILRAASQILFFFLLPGFYVSALSSLRQIYTSAVTGSFSLSAMLPQLAIIIAVFPITILLGRFFCSWMCAFGSLGDLISLISHKLFKRRLRIPPKVDKALRYVKYLVLVFLVIAVWTLGFSGFKSFNPWDVFGIILTPGSAPDFSYAFSALLPGTVILAAIIIASFFVDRFFCRYLCPLGAVFALTSRPRITSIKKPTAGCGKCRACTNACPMGIELYKMDKCKSGECIDCFACVEACPRKNAAFAVSDEDVRPVLAGTMAAAVMAGVYYAGSFESNVLSSGAVGTVSAVAQNDSTGSQYSVTDSSSSAATDSSASSASSSSSASSAASSSSASSSSAYKDGTYQGSGTGYRGGTTTVSVTVKSGKITAITLVSEGDTPDFFQRAYQTIVSEIIGNQSSNVNAVSGATFSSNGIMQAVANALSKAS